MRLLILVILSFQCLCFAEETKIYIITGASGELGAAAATLLAKDYDLILTGRDLLKLKALQTELKSLYPWNYEICSLDYNDSASRDKFKVFLKSKIIAGVLLITPRPQFYGKELYQSEKTWLDVIQNTFTGPLETLKTMIPFLASQGKIVVIAGTTSVQLQPEMGPACVIRRMWTTYSKALSHQLGPQSISINTLSPGIVLTDFHHERIQNKALEKGISYEVQMEQEVASIPLRRHAHPQEVANAIKFLLSDESNFINGANIVLDGGFTVTY